ncbi:restriction endonuclease [Streptomyces sp. SP18CS02]|uniref:restriction endonuclease n=1 Tax=Streptomyces sp. SP18CS02 TaxID=3002531 RepID=UPI002E76EFFB|nr:restriction endonuclease [Streptomyces sp. SP18CS02]MEE1751218.1 restriction endonuclease [Streptomyces sp. SP18CS02]
MSSTHLVLHDPEGRLDAELPLDRELHKALVKAVLGWTSNPALPPADLEQIALLLTGTARTVAADVRRAADLLLEDHAASALADVVLEEADRRLSVPLEGTARCAQGRARLVRALYERLDRLAGVAPQAVRVL